MLKRILVGGTVAACLLNGAAFAGKYVGYRGDYKGEVEAPLPVCLFKPYVGVNFTYMTPNVNNRTITLAGVTTTLNSILRVPNNFYGWSLDSGFRYGQYIGMEFGYYQYGSQSRTINNTTVTMMPKGFYTDFRAYYPIDQFDLIGFFGANIQSFGGARISNSIANITIPFVIDDAVMPRLGVGVAYNFSECWGIRAQGEYSFSSSRNLNGEWSADAGVYYNFV